MPSLANHVETRTLRVVRIEYVSGQIAKWWNSRRKASEVCTFTGFYWFRGSEEMGPFKTRSAAIRDAYYRFVLKREPPEFGGATALRRANESLRHTAQQEAAE